MSTFGSVPLKTYLPDGDIDVVAFAHNQPFRSSWANDVRAALDREEKKQQAEFRVREVQFIQAEVRKRQNRQGVIALHALLMQFLAGTPKSRTVWLVLSRQSPRPIDLLMVLTDPVHRLSLLLIAGRKE